MTTRERDRGERTVRRAVGATAETLVRVTQLEPLRGPTEPPPPDDLPPLSVDLIPQAPLAVGPLDAAGFVDGAEIGRGGMGTVRYVIDRRLLREMALKALPDTLAQRADATSRFIHEAQITGQLDHPNVVPVHELGEDDTGTLYFTMKLVRGRNLAEVIADLGPDRLSAQNLEDLVRIVLKVCDAVSFAHRRGVIHRDLKPANVMVGSHGQVYVMDWGLATLRSGPSLTGEEGKASGTPGYMAPEQLTGKSALVDERSDVYGIGGILYAILTDAPPHDGEPAEAIRSTRHRDVPDPRERAPDLVLPPELCRIALRALAREPAGRYPDVAALQADLEAFLHGGGWLATRSFAANSLLFRAGDEPREAYVVVSGRCEAFTFEGGRRVSLRTTGPGEVVGVTGLLTGRPRSADVVALEDMTVKVVDRDSLEHELEQNNWLRAFVHALGERFRELEALHHEALP